MSGFLILSQLLCRKEGRQAPTALIIYRGETESFLGHTQQRPAHCRDAEPCCYFEPATLPPPTPTGPSRAGGEGGRGRGGRGRFREAGGQNLTSGSPRSPFIGRADLPNSFAVSMEAQKKFGAIENTAGGQWEASAGVRSE